MFAVPCGCYLQDISASLDRARLHTRAAQKSVVGPKVAEKLILVFKLVEIIISVIFLSN